jgi:hypothetical protein
MKRGEREEGKREAGKRRKARRRAAGGGGGRGGKRAPLQGPSHSLTHPCPACVLLSFFLHLFFLLSSILVFSSSFSFSFFR